MPPISFSGLASGIDGDAIIKALLDTKRLADEPLRKRVEDTNKENAALDEFNSKLVALNDAVSSLLTLSGGAVSKTAQSSNSDALGVSAGSNAELSTVNLSIIQLAKSGSISFNDAITDLGAPLAPGLSEPVSLNVTLGSGPNAETKSITLDAETTMNDLVSELNSEASGKMSAYLVNVGTSSVPAYRLVVSATRTGTEAGSISISAPDNLGFFSSQTVQLAQDAKVFVDGFGEVTRASNQINDLFPGLSLELKQENSGPISINVNQDATKTATALQAMLKAFNEVVSYVSKNSKITRTETEKGIVNQYGTLSRTSVDNQAVQALKAALSQVTSGVPDSAVQIFADLGVKTSKDDGTLLFKQEDFDKAMAKDPAAVGKLLQNFADQIGTTNGIISQYTRFQGLIDSTQNSNNEEVKRLNQTLLRHQESLEAQEKSLKLMFSRLESTISDLNSQGDSLSSLLLSRPNNR